MTDHPAPGAAPIRPAPTRAQLLQHLRRANELAARAVAAGHHPFGAILVGPDQATVLLEQGNEGPVDHAEAVLARRAHHQFTPAELWNCTLYTTVEPCAMCAATQYWANIGGLVYGMGERRLLELTRGSSENPTLDIPARYVFAHGQKALTVLGPVPEVEVEIADLHQAFWRPDPKP